MNPKLITWDYNKDATVTLEDALLSFESARFMLGGKIRKAQQTAGQDTTENEQDDKFDVVKVNLNEEVVIVADGTGGKVKLPDIKNHLTGEVYKVQPGINTTKGYKYVNLTQGTRGQVTVNNSSIDEEKPTAGSFEAAGFKVGDHVRIFWTQEVKGTDGEAAEIVISPDMFPGTYRVVGDTFMRSEATGKDEAFQFIIGKAKVLSNTTITLQAEGDPSTNGLLNVEVKAFELRERLKDFFYQLAIAI